MKFAGLLFAGVLSVSGLTNPPLHSYFTYLGPATGTHYAAVDREGYLYVSGITDVPRYPCPNLPATSVPRTVVTKLWPRGDGIAWMTCLPGLTAGIAVDDAGSVYVTSNLDGAANVTKLSSIDARVIYSKSISSAAADDIAVDRDGSAYIAGAATASFATTPGAYIGQTPACSVATPRCSAGFVAKLSGTGAIQFATFVGGLTSAIAVDRQKAVLIAGTFEYVQQFGSGYWTNGFVQKIDSSGGKLLLSTGVNGGLYFRISLSAAIYGLSLDANDAVYIVGRTPLNSAFQTTPGVLQPNAPLTNLFGVYGFLWKLDSAGRTLYATYLGPAAGYVPAAVAADAAGNAYVGLYNGYTTASASMTVVSADGSRVLAAKRLDAPARSISLDGSGGVYVVGITNSMNSLPFPATRDSYVPEATGEYGAYAAKFDFSQPAGTEIHRVVNAASLAPGRNSRGPNGSVAPGEIVTLFGSGFRSGPDLRLDFDGIPAPILYSDAGQINAVVPFKLEPRNAFTLVSVRNGTEAVRPYKLPLAAASPGIFGVALNQDGSVNSDANPAASGSIVTLFLTGAGAYDRAIDDGEPGPMLPPFPVPILGIGGAVNGMAAEILFAGQAPGLVAGVVQVNLQIPDGVPPGAARITMYVGDYPAFSLIAVN